MPTHKELLESLRDGFKNLQDYDEAELDRLKKRGQMVVRLVFGEESGYLTQLRKTKFHPQVYPATSEYRAASWRSGRNGAVNLTETMLEELDLRAGVMENDPKNKTSQLEKSRRVFVVHGHDEGMRESVARVLTKLGLEPVILHEQSDRGKTIIEKFYEHSEVEFAVVALSPDDTGYSNADGPDAARPRARQNVILKLGFFLGRLGRENVVALHSGNVEIPSDFSGVLYTPYYSGGVWPYKLVRELRESGYEVSTDDL